MHEIEKKILGAFLGLVGILFAGTLGYVLIEDWTIGESLFMTVITVSTVGYGTVRELSPWGMAFTSALILLGFGAFAYLATQFAQFLIHGEITRAFGKRKMKQQIQEMRGHYVVCGYGRVGETVCEELVRGGMSVVVIEVIDDLAQRAQAAGLPVVAGDSMSDATLQEAGVERAAGLVSAVSDDADNLLIALSARELNHNLYIVARGEHPEIESKLLRAGADTVISPFRLTGRQIAGLVLSGQGTVEGPGEGPQAQGAGMSLRGYRLESYQPSGGRVATVAEAVAQRGAVAAVGLEREDGTHHPNPPADTVVGLRDRLILARFDLGGATGSKVPPPETVLIADDHQALLKVFVKKIRAAGYEVLPASTGSEALEKIQTMRPSLAVLDAMMPGKTGYEICEVIRADPELAPMPLILFSASNLSDLQKRGKEVGADRVMQKTGKSSELLAAVEDLLRERREKAE